MTLSVLVACNDGPGPAGLSVGASAGMTAASGGDNGSTSATSDAPTSGAGGGESSGTSGTSGTTSTTTGEASTTATTTAPALKFDLAAQPDLATTTPCAGGDVEFSYIWISNSPEGTVSKIDTRSRLEVARYVTGPEESPDPSRTSVNLRGDVAVVNRSGSITKMWARAADCVDGNGNGTIDTSQGPADVRAWGEDECVAWNTPLLYASRPAAWTSGTVLTDKHGCPTHADPEVWTGAPDGMGGANVYLLNGADGSTIGSVNLPGVDGGFGIYGGAVDAANDFWGAVWSTGPLVHVRHDDLSHELIAVPDPDMSFFTVYGFTVDHAGRAWVGGQASLQRYDPSTATWTKVALPRTYGSLSRGMQEDANGHLWVAALTQGILRVDTDSATFVDLIDGSLLPQLEYPAGISVDVDGQVWMVDTDANGAHVVDPDSYAVHFVGGLVGPYTYSDMTGWALKNVIAVPEG